MKYQIVKSNKKYVILRDEGGFFKGLGKGACGQPYWWVTDGIGSSSIKRYRTYNKAFKALQKYIEGQEEVVFEVDV